MPVMIQLDDSEYAELQRKAEMARISDVITAIRAHPEARRLMHQALGLPDDPEDRLRAAIQERLDELNEKTDAFLSAHLNAKKDKK